MSTAPEYDDDVVRAGEYALGLLSRDEARAFEARLVGEPDLRALYAAWAEEFAVLADDIPEEAPRHAVRERIEAELFGAPDKGIWARLGLGRGLIGLAVATALAFVVFGTDLLERGPVAPDTPTQVAEIAAEDGTLVLAAAYEAETGRLFLDRQEGEARPGRVLELWLIEGGNAPVSLGVLPEDPQAEVIVAADRRELLSGGVLAISDEPPGGSPTGAPTGDVLAVGPVQDV